MELAYTGKVPAEDVISQPVSGKLRRTKLVGEGEADNRLIQGENLSVLRLLLDDSMVRGKVQLVYIDPPYASNQSFRHRKKQTEHAYDDVLAGHAYVEFLRHRLILLRELMSDDGSIYVHLDSNMAFHMKIIMDEVFGEKNFRNWITRKKCHSKNYTRKQYGNVADYILFYGKSANVKWNRPYEEENIYTFEQRFPRVDPETGKRFALVPIHAPGTRNGETGKEWRGMMPPDGKHWQVKPAELDRLDAAGEIYWSPTGNPRRKIFADDSKGVPVQDIWLKFMDFRNQNMSETGYPTEKNASLLRRIVTASSSPGDLVLDCFCGSGTTLAVARDTGRRWIGIDSSKLAIETSTERLSEGHSTKYPKPAKNGNQGTLFDLHDNEENLDRQFKTFEVSKLAEPKTGAKRKKAALEASSK